jgi:hypothetical protein
MTLQDASRLESNLGVPVAQQVVTIRTDDITGQEIPDGEGETVVFAVGGAQYEIDLNPKNAKKFHDALQLYIAHGRKVGRAGVTSINRGRPVRKTSDFNPAAVRAWADSNGYQVSPRGRIKAEIIEAFRAAGN